MISKKLFCYVLESIMIQMLQDNSIGTYFIVNSSMNGVDTTPKITYNTNRIITSCIKLLQEYFPKDEHGFCEISHFCFDLEFGKPTVEGNETETFEQLYKRLLNNI